MKRLFYTIQAQFVTVQSLKYALDKTTTLSLHASYKCHDLLRIIK